MSRNKPFDLRRTLGWWRFGAILIVLRQTACANVMANLKYLNKLPSTRVVIAADKWMVRRTGVGSSIFSQKGRVRCLKLVGQTKTRDKYKVSLMNIRVFFNLTPHSALTISSCKMMLTVFAVCF